MGRSSFQEASEVIHAISVQGKYFKNNSKMGLLSSWEEAPFKRFGKFDAPKPAKNRPKQQKTIKNTKDL